MHIVLAQFYSHVVTPDYDEIARILRERGYRAWVATPNEDGSIEWWDGQELAGVQPVPPLNKVLEKILRPFSRRIRDYRHMWRVRKFLQQVCPDVVQVNPASVHGVWLLTIANRSSLRFVIDWRQIGEGDTRGVLGFAKRWWIGLRRKVLSRLFFDKACFLHEAGAVRVLGPNWARWAAIVPLGVDHRFLETKKDMRGESEDDAANVVQFLYIGTLSRVRKLERLFEAAAILKSQSSNFHVALVGPNRAGDYYSRLITELGIESLVSLHPPVAYQDVPNVILKYDVAFAIVPEEPADWQYHPTLKVLEYRALGVPIIATDVAPNRDIVQNDLNGYLVQNTPEDFADAMFRFVHDPAWLRQITSEAQAMRAGRPWEYIVDLYLHDVYLEPNVDVPAMVVAKERHG